jgi:hypothetical protein
MTTDESKRAILEQLANGESMAWSIAPKVGMKQQEVTSLLCAMAGNEVVRTARGVYKLAPGVKIGRSPIKAVIDWLRSPLVVGWLK